MMANLKESGLKNGTAGWKAVGLIAILVLIGWGVSVLVQPRTHTEGELFFTDVIDAVYWVNAMRTSFQIDDPRLSAAEENYQDVFDGQQEVDRAVKLIEPWENNKNVTISAAANDLYTGMNKVKQSLNDLEKLVTQPSPPSYQVTKAVSAMHAGLFEMTNDFLETLIKGQNIKLSQDAKDRLIKLIQDQFPDGLKQYEADDPNIESQVMFIGLLRDRIIATP